MVVNVFLKYNYDILHQTTNGVEDGINGQRDIQGHKTMDSTSSDVSEMRSEQV